MKKNLLFILCLFCSGVFAQADLHCATDIAMKELFKKNPQLRSKLLAHESVQRTKNANKSIAASYTIPVVFHILHLGGPENISDSQVIDGLNILNNDFAKRNADTSLIIPSFQSIADSTGIQFALATIDPQGNCTNGIIHYYDTDADWNDMSPTICSYTWDPMMYLNVYVVKTITLSGGFGAAGYTYLPGSLSPGDPFDAIVILNNYFGSTGTGTAFQSRVLTHEVGHWLNLLHVFGWNSAGADCSGDDFVNDTPTTPGYLLCPDAAVPSSYQVCTPGVDENFQNYMDYSYCCKMFTGEQGLRMRMALNDNIAGRDNLWTQSNLIATGVLNPSAPCIPIADFNYDRSVTCTGVPVTFTDASWNGQPTSYSWSFPSGNPSTSTSASPVVTYSTPGVYSATLTTSNASGTSAPVTKTNIITVVNNTATYQTTWFDGFESNPLPNTDWSVSNTSGGAIWEQTPDAAYTGSFSAKLPSAGNTRNAKATMTGPSVNLSAIPNPALTFKVAATELNLNHINRLEAFISTDCEQTWNVIYSKSGMNLITTIDSISPFIPFQQSQWRSESVSLAAYAGASSARIKFVYTRDTLPAPSNVYIDNVNIITTTGTENTEAAHSLTLFPNPSGGECTLMVELTRPGNITIRVCDVTGRKAEEVESGRLSAGTHTFDIGKSTILKSGVYLLSITAGEKTFVKKLLVE